MTSEDDFRIRPGRIRSRQIQHAKPFVAQALAAAQKAGGHVSRQGRIGAPRASRFGRGRVASVQANRLLTSRSRLATIKTRIVRHSARRATLGPHLNYLQREGVTRDGEKARMFGPEADKADVKEFTERCEDDRHHFRFIVSPEDASEMADLKGFARDLMSSGREGPRHQTRLGRGRSLEHRQPARPHHPARLCRRREGPRHRAGLHQRRHAGEGAGSCHAGARSAHRS